MTTDDYGTEYQYPPEKWVQSGRICAADEQHEALERRIETLENEVREMVGARLRSNTEGRIESAWSAIKSLAQNIDAVEASFRSQRTGDELRIAALETQVHRLLNSEQPHPPEADYAHIPAAEWEAICAELEGLRVRAERAENEARVWHTSWELVHSERDALLSKWKSVPWKELNNLLFPSKLFSLSSDTMRATAVSWCVENTPPKEDAE